MIAVRAGQILTPLTCIEPGILLVENGVIQDIIVDKGQELLDMEVMDAKGSILAPGLIDLHTHGIGGMQVIDGKGEDLAMMSEHYARHGVTGFLATIGGTKPCIEAGIRAVLESHSQGAEILGIHLEGPFINPARKGAFSLETIVPPDLALFQEYVQKAQGAIRMVTLAPEMDGALELVKYARTAGIVCSAGHSQATWEQMMSAADAGISHVTHTYNGMAPFNHRQPGILGAALTDDRLTVEIIADGIHVHPAAVKLLLRCKPANRVVVVSDSIGATSLPDGVYRFEELDISIANHSARIKDGTLAGSMITMEKELVNLIHFGELALKDALWAVSLNQAAELGLEQRKGVLAAGKDADVVCLDRQDYSLQWTMVKGRLIKAEPAVPG
jgi:N-acetylglucosamine-6-phosphate deacetylase